MRLILLSVLVCCTSIAQDSVLLRLLDRQTRKLAAEELKAGAEGAIPGLLDAVAGLRANEADPFELREALVEISDICAEKKIAAAIPFLIDHILLDRYHTGFVWMKSEETILARMPAMNALVRIGPVATDALMRSYLSQSSSDHRLALVFVISRIGDVAAKRFLGDVIANANLEAHLAREALARIK